MAQRAKSSEFISPGSKAFLHIRLGRYFPSLEGMGLLRRLLQTMDIAPKLTLQTRNDMQTV